MVLSGDVDSELEADVVIVVGVVSVEAIGLIELVEDVWNIVNICHRNASQGTVVEPPALRGSTVDPLVYKGPLSSNDTVHPLAMVVLVGTLVPSAQKKALN